MHAQIKIQKTTLNCNYFLQPLNDRNEIFASIRPQIKVDRRGKVYTPMHMRYHLVKYVEQNFELVQLLVSAPLESRRMTLQQYATKMSIGDTCGYEVTLLILSEMFKVPLLVIRADMLWISRNVKPIDCPIVLVQRMNDRFLGTRTKTPVFVGTVPRIKLTVKRSETSHITHSTPARNTEGSSKQLEKLMCEVMSPIVQEENVQAIHADHNYSFDGHTNTHIESSLEFTNLDCKKSMSTEYPEGSVVDANRSMNSEDESTALVNYPALDGSDEMDKMQLESINKSTGKNTSKCNDGESSGTEEIDVDNCESDEQNLGDDEEAHEPFEDGQKILHSEDKHLDNCESDAQNLGDDEQAEEPLQDGQQILPSEENDNSENEKTVEGDTTIDPDATIDPNGCDRSVEHEIVDKVQNITEPTEVTTYNKVETNTDNIIADSPEDHTPKRRRLGIFGPKFKRQKVSVKLQDISVDLAMPLNEHSVLNVKKADESQDNYIVQYCCDKCQERTFTIEGYETHLFHAHQIRNVEKYPPTIIRKTYKSPESLHLDSVTTDQNEFNDNTQNSHEEDHLNVDQPNNITDGEHTVNEDNEDNPEEGNGKENGDDVSNSEHSRHETTESADGELLRSSESEPLMFPHFSEQFNTHPDKPTIQCPKCPQKFFYQGGLRHHLETHNKYRDLPKFQCPECSDKFFYQSGLDHHYETHVRQRRRESGLYSDEENNETIEPSDQKEIPKQGTKRPKKTNSKNASGSKKNKKTINSDEVNAKESGSIVSPSSAPTKKSSINSDVNKKPSRGRGRPRKGGKLPKRHKGKLIKTEADLNTSEDTERHKDIEVGNAALDRYKKRKRDQEEAIFASIRATYNLRSAGDSGDKSIHKEVSNKEEKSSTVSDKPEKQKTTKNPNKRKGQTEETDDRKSKKPKNKVKNKEDKDGTVSEEIDEKKPKKTKNEAQKKKEEDGNVLEETEEEISMKQKNKSQNKETLDLTEGDETEDKISKKPKNKRENKEEKDGTVAEEIEQDTASNAEDKEQKTEKTKKPKNKKGTKPTNGSKSEKNGNKDTPENETGNGKSLRSRTIKSAQPSTSVNDDQEEALEAEEFTCKICSKTFKNYNEIKAHKLLCTKLKKKYACSVCSKGFTQKSMLEDHFDYMHTNKPKKYRCKPCNKTFEQKKVYLEHNRRLHNKSDYKYVCDECGRGFFVKGEFTCHRLSHTGVKPFACGVCNVARFATPGRLNAHLAKCGKPLAFQCDLCGKHFSSKQAVDVHIAEAHATPGNNKTWDCPLCEDVHYSSQGGWYKHLCNQHGITRYGKKLEEAIIEEAQKNAENQSDESSKSEPKDTSENED